MTPPGFISVVSALPDQMWDTLQLVVDEPSKLKLPEIAQQMSDMLQLVVGEPSNSSSLKLLNKCPICFSLSLSCRMFKLPDIIQANVRLFA